MHGLSSQPTYTFYILNFRYILIDALPPKFNFKYFIYLIILLLFCTLIHIYARTKRSINYIYFIAIKLLSNNHFQHILHLQMRF